MSELVQSNQLPPDMAARLTALKGKLWSVEKAPALYSFNGCGTTLMGMLIDPGLRPAYFTRLFVIFLWIPIFGRKIYLVTNSRSPEGHLLSNTFNFMGQMNAADFHQAYQGKVFQFYWRALGRGIVMLLSIGGFVFLMLWLAQQLGAHHTALRIRL
jgi:hypothetical protein